jgi:catechol 2,3-dioxygenase-like lactoylglutathione lyase family enzyme
VVTLKSLDHVNIRTARLAEVAAFYAEVLGLKSGARPPFSFGGAWLYCGDRAAIHVVEVAKTPTNTEPRIDHFAFRAQGLAEFLARLRQMGVAYRIGVVPDYGIRQVNVRDPDGNRIEIQFAATEEADLGDFPG